MKVAALLVLSSLGVGCASARALETASAKQQCDYVGEAARNPRSPVFDSEKDAMGPVRVIWVNRDSAFFTTAGGHVYRCP